MFYREKAYTRINWKNRPNLSTPLGAKNLNKMDATLNELDDRIIEVSSEVESDSLIIGFISDKVNALEEDVDENTSQINELSNLAEDVNGLKIVNTASGTTAYMDDASNLNIEDITFFGESTQNGTPTPTNPIPIESKIVNRVDVLGKNWLQNTAQSRTDAGLTYTVNDNKSVTVNGNATGLSIVKVGSFKNTDRDLILSGCPSGGSNSTYKLSYYHETTQVNDFGNGVTLPKNDLTYEVRIVIYGGTTINNLTFKPMIRLASITDATYEPYQSQTVNLSAPIELNGIGGVRDTDKLKNIYVKVFTGNESFYTYTPGVGGIQFGYEDENIMRIESENVLCTHLPPKFTWNVREDGIALTINNFVVRFRMESLGISTVGDLKAKLKEWYDAGNPMVLYAPIKTPIETSLLQADIDAIKNLHTYKPNTVVMNDADAEMDVSYVADPRLYIDKKFEALASAIVNQ